MPSQVVVRVVVRLVVSIAQLTMAALVAELHKAEHRLELQ